MTSYDAVEEEKHRPRPRAAAGREQRGASFEAMERRPPTAIMTPSSRSSTSCTMRSELVTNQLKRGLPRTMRKQAERDQSARALRGGLGDAYTQASWQEKLFTDRRKSPEFIDTSDAAAADGRCCGRSRTFISVATDPRVQTRRRGQPSRRRRYLKTPINREGSHGGPSSMKKRTPCAEMPRYWSSGGADSSHGSRAKFSNSRLSLRRRSGSRRRRQVPRRGCSRLAYRPRSLAIEWVGDALAWSIG